MQQGKRRDEQKKGLLERLMMRVKTDRRLELALYGAVALLAIGLYAASLLPGRAERAKASVSQASQAVSRQDEIEVEARLRRVLSRIRGAGEVEVMITYETGSEIVAAMNINKNVNSSETSDGDKTSASTQTTESAQPATVDADGGNEPIILLEKTPTVRGVIVVAEGAADVWVKLDLQRAVQAVLDIPLSRIEVFELSKINVD